MGHHRHRNQSVERNAEKNARAEGSWGISESSAPRSNTALGSSRRNQLLRVESNLLDRDRESNSGYSLCQNVEALLVPCMHEWIEVHDWRHVLVLTGDE